MRRAIITAITAITALPLPVAARVGAQPAKSGVALERPDIVFIMADNLGYGHLGCYGRKKIRTPRIDRMAREGTRVTQLYAGNCVCAPSLSVLMTGLHSGHTSVRVNGGKTSLRADDVTIAELLSDDPGYTCGIFGKWGIGDVGDRSGKLVAVNGPRLEAVWTKCGELGIPVVIHTADPDAFFLQVDAENEQYGALVRKPAWSFHGRDFPSKDTLLAQRNDIIERHPRTTFVGLHMANRTENLAEVTALLEKHPNLHVEFGARVNELGRQPYTARKFFLKHQDRILFGLDRPPPIAYHYRVYFRFLETWDEHFDYDRRPGLGRWKIYGIGLPDDVLKKVYYKNALKLLKLEKLASS